jgi:hypothetical protein
VSSGKTCCRLFIICSLSNEKKATDTPVPSGQAHKGDAFFGNKAVYSTDGISWTAATLPSSVNWTSIAVGSGKFVAIAGYGSSNQAAYCNSSIPARLGSTPTGRLPGQKPDKGLSKTLNRLYI